MKPIIFDAESVRAILAGRKTQFRVPLKPQPTDYDGRLSCGVYAPTVVDRRTGEQGPGPDTYGAYSDDGESAWPCPLGGPGARVAVKESGYWNGGAWCYRADYRDEIAKGIRWRNPHFMPHVSSRITLEIVSVRVERVQDISEHDAIAEGVDGWMQNPKCETARDGYRVVWNRKYAKRGYPWASNPWVWAIKFRTITTTAADAAGD